MVADQKLRQAPISYPTLAVLERARDRYRHDLYAFGVEVLGFADADPEVHGRFCRFIEETHPRKLVVGTRGIFKTSFGTIARALQLALIDPDNRILILSNTDRNARKIVLQIRTYLDRNPRVRALFGDMIPKSTSDIPWSTQAVMLVRPGIFPEATFTATGVDSQMASAHFDWILGDDIVAANRDDLREQGMIILRPEELEKAIAYYKLTMRGLQIISKDPAKRTKVQFIVNRWAVEDFASYICREHLYHQELRPDGFKFLQLAAHNEDGSLLLPDLLPEVELARIHADQGDFMYYTQYECKPYNPDARGFPPACNSFFTPDEEGRPPGWQKMRAFALMDLADSSKPSSCYTAFVVVWADRDSHLYVGEAIRKQIDTVGKIELIVAMLKKYGVALRQTIHIEKNLHDDTLRYVLKNELRKRDTYCRVIPMEHKNRNKDARIVRLQPHHESQSLHCLATQKHLLQEMRDFPFTHHKDILDALGYMMDILKRPLRVKKRPQDAAGAAPQEVLMSDVMQEIKERVSASWGGEAFSLQGRNFDKRQWSFLKPDNDHRRAV